MIYRQTLRTGILLFLAFTFSLTAMARTPLTFEDRVKAQEAIERVYYAHRIWPKENPKPKPPFEEMVPRAVIEAKVTDYLKKCVALDRYWQRSIQPEQLQAEMDRMAKGTKDPDTLRELFANLGNDPYLIAECLARPVLAERLDRNWYPGDSQFRCGDKGKAQEARREEDRGGLLEEQRAEDLAENMSGMRLGYKDSSAFAFSFPREENCQGVWVHSSLNDALDGQSLPATVWTGTEMIVWGGSYLNVGSRYNPSTDTWTPTSTGPNCPIGRKLASGVWTGTEMIVWGGSNGTNAYLDTGGRYNPTTDSWVSTSTGNACPEARFWHTAVWTGTEMIIWGGKNSSGCLQSGSRYNPGTDIWAATSWGVNCPVARWEHTAVWTGSEMIVWGGSSINGYPYLITGGRYDPSSDLWTPTSIGANCPGGRYNHTAVWTGNEMVVWGGHHNSGTSGEVSSGGRYNPSEDSWTATSIGTNCPKGREKHRAVWTGNEMIVWGGEWPDNLGVHHYENSGGRYDPSTDIWNVTPTAENCPAGRSDHIAVWTGTEMIIWGGHDNGSLNTGGRFNPGLGTWVATSTGNGTPEGRIFHTAVWTGAEMIVWGGWDGNYFNSGGRYYPATDSWASTSLGTNCPSTRDQHTAVWTGSEMVIWGGYNGNSSLNTGSRYNPVADRWTPISTGEYCPGKRSYHTAIWTGTQMIVWGGVISSSPYRVNTGGRYDPSTDTWLPTSTGDNCPSARGDHTAIWTGVEMIVWGGGGSGGQLNTGGRYNPITDTWFATSTGVDCPLPRLTCTAIWTGAEMIVWGGRWYDGVWHVENSGARYIPSVDDWIVTPTGGSCPEGRYGHTAIWTGTEMVLWGGSNGTYMVDSGARLTPATSSWVVTPTGPYCAIRRADHTAIWTGSSMIIWGGGYWLAKGGILDLGSACSCSLVCEASTQPSQGRAPLLVAFTAALTPSNCTGEATYTWAFGDGQTSVEQNPSHIYTNAGIFSWTMTATVQEVACSKTGTVTVEPGLPGDCDGDESVSIGEVQKAINMFLGTLVPGCGVDCNGDGAVSIGEVQKVINAFLGLAVVC